MKLLKAYTAIDDGVPTLVFQFAGNPEAIVDVYHKRTLADAGVIILFPRDPDAELEGFSSVSARVDREDAGTLVEIEAGPREAATLDPLVVHLARKFFESTDDGSFESGVRVFHA
jgi:hypothetical protein